MNVVCISGKAQHGKDTTAGIIKELLESKGQKVLIAHYGDLVKYICRTFFNWNGEKDADGRHLLQYVGTDVIRERYPNYWVDFVAEMLEVFYGEWDWVLIPAETALDDYCTEWYLFNDGTIENLKTTVNTWFEEIYYAD